MALIGDYSLSGGPDFPRGGENDVDLLLDKCRSNLEVYEKVGFWQSIWHPNKYRCRRANYWWRWLGPGLEWMEEALPTPHCRWRVHCLDPWKEPVILPANRLDERQLRQFKHPKKYNPQWINLGKFRCRSVAFLVIFWFRFHISELSSEEYWSCCVTVTSFQPFEEKGHCTAYSPYFPRPCVIYS